MAVKDKINQTNVEDILISLGLIIQKDEITALFDGEAEIDF
jgi:hypothetical protein